MPQDPQSALKYGKKGNAKGDRRKSAVEQKVNKAKYVYVQKDVVSTNEDNLPNKDLKDEAKN